MTGCFFNTPRHSNVDILPVRLGMQRELKLACAGCRESIAESGFLRIVDRRIAQAEFAGPEKRSFRPAWLSRLTARETTGLVR